jgi:hypothetical protein
MARLRDRGAPATAVIGDDRSEMRTEEIDLGSPLAADATETGYEHHRHAAPDVVEEELDAVHGTCGHPRLPSTEVRAKNCIEGSC